MEFQADLALLPNMLDFIRSHVEHLTDEQTLLRLDLACEEALVNVISYGYPERKGGESLTIECALKENHAFVVTIRDEGIPFNPLEQPITLDEGKPLRERKVGGLGIHLMKKVAKELHYEREKGENRLALSFLLTPPSLG